MTASTTFPSEPILGCSPERMPGPSGIFFALTHDLTVRRSVIIFQLEEDEAVVYPSPRPPTPDPRPLTLQDPMAYRVVEEPTRNRARGRPMRVLRILPREGQRLSGEELAAAIERLAARGPEWEIMPSLQIPGLGWRSANGWFTAGERVQLLENSALYDMVDIHTGEEIPQVHEAILYLRRRAQQAGGCRPGNEGKNDCLWRAIFRCLDGQVPQGPAGNECRDGTNFLLSDEGMRGYLGVPLGKKIPATPKIFSALEAELGPRIKLILTGDAQYCSAKKAPRIVHIRLNGEHYTHGYDSRRKHQNYVCLGDKQKPLRILVPAGDAWKAVGPDGSTTTVSVEKASAWRRKPMEAPFVFLEHSGEGETAGKTLADWAASSAALKTALHIDLDRLGSYRRAALEYWFLKSLSVPQAAALHPMEEEWIGGGRQAWCALRGGLIYAPKEVFEGSCVALDVVSMYPSIMASETLNLPMGQPSIQRLTTLKAHPSIGLYRCSIAIPERMQKLWRGSAGEAIYTNRDIELAHLLGGEIELAQDDQANAMIYPVAECVKMSHVFGPYVQRLFALKRDGVPGAKRMLTVLWGALAARNKVKQTLRLDADAELEGEMVGFEGGPHGSITYHCRPDGQPMFKGEMPRAGVFITANARYKIAEMLIPHVDKLRRLHTDGFVLEYDQVPDHLRKLIGAELGQLKLEHTGQCAIEGFRRPTWHEE